MNRKETDIKSLYNKSLRRNLEVAACPTWHRLLAGRPAVLVV